MMTSGPCSIPHPPRFGPPVPSPGELASRAQAARYAAMRGDTPASLRPGGDRARGVAQRPAEPLSVATELTTTVNDQKPRYP